MRTTRENAFDLILLTIVILCSPFLARSLAILVLEFRHHYVAHFAFSVLILLMGVFLCLIEGFAVAAHGG